MAVGRVEGNNDDRLLDVRPEEVSAYIADHTKAKLVSYIMYGLDAIIDG